MHPWRCSARPPPAGDDPATAREPWWSQCRGTRPQPNGAGRSLPPRHGPKPRAPVRGTAPSEEEHPVRRKRRTVRGGVETTRTRLEPDAGQPKLNGTGRPTARPPRRPRDSGGRHARARCRGMASHPNGRRPKPPAPRGAEAPHVAAPTGEGLSQPELRNRPQRGLTGPVTASGEPDRTRQRVEADRSFGPVGTCRSGCSTCTSRRRSDGAARRSAPVPETASGRRSGPGAAPPREPEGGACRSESCRSRLSPTNDHPGAVERGREPTSLLRDGIERTRHSPEGDVLGETLS